MSEPVAETMAYAKSAPEVIALYHVDPAEGYTSEQADSVRSEHGPNRLATAPPKATWKKLLSQFNELVIWILVVAAVIAGLMGEWIDATAIISIVLLNGLLGFIQEERAGQALAALKAMSAPSAKVRRNGKLQSVAAENLVAGDVIQIEAGDSIPADARLVESFGLSVQEASLTGESLPVAKDAALVLPQLTPLGDRKNSVFMGSNVTHGNALAIVTATGMRTELGQIAGMLHSEDNEPTPLQRRLAELGRVLVIVCTVLVGIIFFIQFFRGNDILETLLVAVSLAVAAVPEGLPAVVTIALALGLQRMVRQNALIRKLPSVETLGSVTVICSDKTGTLTRNEMTVREIAVGTASYRVTGAGYDPVGEFVRDADENSVETKVDPREIPDLKQALTIAVQCNTAELVRQDDGQLQVIGDPTEGALIVAAQKAGILLAGGKNQIIYKIPFDSERKAMSVVERTGSGNVMYSKGAPEVILDKCSHELVSNQIVELTAERRAAITQQNSTMAAHALRVLALAYRPNPVQQAGHFREDELVFAGQVGINDPPREEVKLAVRQCHSAGIRPIMITGDHPETAFAIACELEIASPQSQVMTGAELDDIDDDELERIVDSTAVFARVSAAHKLRVVKAWKRRGQVVAMTGDGVNDAPAIKSADIGIAMGVTGTDVTKEAADMVLTDDNFASIVNAVKEGRGIFDNIQKFVHYLLSCNAGEVMFMFAAALLGYPVPLLAIQILWINLVTDGFPALALAMEPPEPDIMERQPRPPREPVITRQRGILIVYHGSLVAIAALIGFWWASANDPENVQVARTTAFAIMAFSQLALALVCRSQRYTLPQLGVFSNRWLFVAFVISGLLQIGVLTIPFAQYIFDVAPIVEIPWLAVMLLSLVPATIIEVTKIVYQFVRRDTGPTQSTPIVGVN